MSKLAIFGGKPVRKRLFPARAGFGLEEKRAVKRVMDSGVLSRYLGEWGPDFYGGPEVQAFEKEWAKYFGVKHAFAINSCTSGLQCAAGAAGISPGDEIIVSPFTMSASATAPLIWGGIPIFADIEEEYFCLDPKSVEARITPKTKAIIVVDIFGQPYDRDAINNIAKKHGLIVIEDAAQAPCAFYGKEFAGTLGDIGVYSLNYHKHIHTGEGGVVVTNNDVLAEKIRLIRNHAEAVFEGSGARDLTNMVGFNFRMTEIQAAIGREQLKKLKSLVGKRVANCEYIAERLSGLPGIRAAGVREKATHAYYDHVFLFDETSVGVPRNRFIEAVKPELSLSRGRETEGVQVGYGYVKPLYLLPLFQKKIAIGENGFPFALGDPSLLDKNYELGSCPVAERMHDKELVSHGFMDPSMHKKDLEDVVNAFHKVYKHRNELK